MVPRLLIIRSSEAYTASDDVDQRARLDIGHSWGVKLLEEFIKYAQKQKGVVFMRKDEIAKWALTASNVPHET